MRKNQSVLFLYLLVATAQIHGFCIDKPGNSSQNKFLVEQYDDTPLHNYFSPTQMGFNQEQIITDPIMLQKAAQDTLHYLNQTSPNRFYFINPKNFGENILSIEQVKKTLEYVVNVIEEDKEHKNFRILDPSFINQHFSLIKWSGCIESAKEHGDRFMQKDKIRLTHYAVYNFSGSYERTAKNSYALYRINYPYISLPYTKQEILTGVLDLEDNKKKAKPLVWLSREGLEEAMMQGTILVTMPDGKTRAFSVHCHNGISYDNTKKDIKQQRRYWYFREMSNDQTQKLIDNFNNRRSVVFAGNIYAIGLGKLIAIKYQNPKTKQEQMQLGVLADTGSAFWGKNLYQLDFFAGMFTDKNSLRKHMQHTPNVVDAYILHCKP